MPIKTAKIIPDTSSNALSYSGNYRIFSTEAPICDALRVIGIIESVDPGSGDVSNLNRYFRYSLDRTNWSLWYDFVQTGSPVQGMDAIELVQMNPDADLYLEYKYAYDDGTLDPLQTPLRVNSISTRIETRAIPVPLDLDAVCPCNCTSEFCPTLVFDRNATFDPYDIGNFVNLYAETSLYVNKTFGLPVVYFRTMPAKGGGDYVFKEWNLFDVVERKCIKVVVPTNDFPDSKLHYNGFGVDYEVPFEVHIDKRYFEMMFNPSADVRKKDFLYFPMLNRMYEIQGSYMFRGLMMAPLYWKAQLVKFNPNINYLMKAEDTLFLDNLLLDSEDTLSQVANGDIRDAVMPNQYQTISDRYNETRSDLNGSLVVRQERFYFNYASLIDYYYDFSQGLAPASVAVAYKNTGVFNDEYKNLTFTWMFNARTAGQSLNFIESKMAGSPDPQTGIIVTGLITGTTLRVYVTLNGTTKSYSFLNVSTGRWYSFVMTMSREFKQFGIFMYDPVDDTADALNHNEFALKAKYVEPMADLQFDTGAGYVLRQSPIYMANVRIFNRVLRYEDHGYVLSQLFVRDEQMLYLIDNCRPKLNMPIVARVR